MLARRGIGLVLVALLVLSGASIAWSEGILPRYAAVPGAPGLPFVPQTDSFPSLPPACFAASDEQAMAACLGPAFHAIAGGHGEDVSSALDEMSARVGNGTLDDCHLLAHALGWAVWDSTPNLRAAMSRGNALCEGGFYHGVVEAYMEATNTEPEAAGNLMQACQALVAQSEPEVMECAHGAGHGFMQRTGMAIGRSLAGCAAFSIASERSYCADGVFMERAMMLLLDAREEFVSAIQVACAGLGLDPVNLSDCEENLGEIATIYEHHALAPAWADCELVGRGALQTAGAWGCERGVDHELQIQADERGEDESPMDALFWHGAAERSLADITWKTNAACAVGASAPATSGCGRPTAFALAHGEIVAPETARLRLLLWYNETVTPAAPPALDWRAADAPGVDRASVNGTKQPGGGYEWTIDTPSAAWDSNGSVFPAVTEWTFAFDWPLPWASTPSPPDSLYHVQIWGERPEALGTAP